MKKNFKPDYYFTPIYLCSKISDTLVKFQTSLQYLLFASLSIEISNASPRTKTSHPSTPDISKIDRGSTGIRVEYS